MNKKFNITSEQISGFTQSNSSFVISYTISKSGILIRPIPVFNLTQSNLDYDLFMKIKKYLGIGKVYNNRQNINFLVKFMFEIVEILF